MNPVAPQLELLLPEVTGWGYYSRQARRSCHSRMRRCHISRGLKVAVTSFAQSGGSRIAPLTGQDSWLRDSEHISRLVGFEARDNFRFLNAE